MTTQEEAFLHDAARHLRNARTLLQAGQCAGATSCAIRSLQRTFFALLISEGIQITFDPGKRYFHEEIQPRFNTTMRQWHDLFSDAFIEQVIYAESLWPTTAAEYTSIQNPESPYREYGQWIHPEQVLGKAEASRIVYTADEALRIVHDHSPKLRSIQLNTPHHAA